MKHPFPLKKVIKIYGMESRCLFKMAMYVSNPHTAAQRKAAGQGTGCDTRRPSRVSAGGSRMMSQTQQPDFPSISFGSLSGLSCTTWPAEVT